jgi:hypothetical protein
LALVSVFAGVAGVVVVVVVLVLVDEDESLVDELLELPALLELLLELLP